MTLLWWLWAYAAWAAKRAGYWVRPYDMLADRRRWCWQRRQRCGLPAGLFLEVRPTPCANGFHWIGQSFATCDQCGLPAWEHDGMAVPDRALFSTGPLVLRPWEPGQRERIKAKWGPNKEES